MRRAKSTSRWSVPGPRYKGGWHGNPWIDAVFSASQVRGETDGSPATPARIDGIQERQHWAAMKIWENEGGSLAVVREFADDSHPAMLSADQIGRRELPEQLD